MSKDILDKIASIKSSSNPRKMIKAEFADKIKGVDGIEKGDLSTEIAGRVV
jgi:hypothetical protein